MTSIEPDGCPVRHAHPRPRVSVVVPHLDDLERLMACVSALEAQTLPREQFEIVIGDNGSRCGLDAVRRAAPGAHVVAVSERGAGPARNHAVAASCGSVIAFTDSDCIPDPEWLREGLAALSRADLAGGAVEVGVRDAKAPSGAEAFELVFAFDNKRYVEERSFSVTANLFARRNVFDAIGPFRVGVPEDLDWCRRAMAAGYSIGYAPNAIVMHPARESFAALAGKWRRLTDEAFADWQDQGGSRAGWLGMAAQVLASPAGHAGRVFASQRIGGLPTRLNAAATLFRIRALRARWMLSQALQAASKTQSGPALGPQPHHSHSE